LLYFDHIWGLKAGFTMMRIIAIHIILLGVFAPCALLAQGSGNLVASDYAYEVGDMQVELDAAEQYFSDSVTSDEGESFGQLSPASGGIENDAIASIIFAGKPTR
jgi:hypothetical protein